MLGAVFMNIISGFKPEPIKYSTEERWAVFVIERQFKGNENTTEKVTQFIGVFDSPSKAGDFIHYQLIAIDLKRYCLVELGLDVFCHILKRFLKFNDSEMPC